MELLENVRRGDEAAFNELFVRHRAVARRVALTYRYPGDPDDLVNEAFEKVFAAVRRGSGPTDAFRAYLLVTMRRLAADHAERPQPERLDDVPDTVLAAVSEPPLDTEDRALITRAFESLPDRWQAVLWYTAVEGRSPRELAPVLGVTANAVSALAYRAREQLRQAFLQAHLQTWARPQCEPHRSLLGAYVRDGQSRRERAATQRHLDTCPSCQALVAELNEVNSMLVRAVAPLFPAAALTAKLAPAATGAAAAAADGAGAPAGSVAEAAEAGAHAARRGLGGMTWLKEAGTVAGATAAAAGLLAGLVTLGAHVGGTSEPDVATRTEETRRLRDPGTTAPAPAAPPSGPQPCPEAAAAGEGASPGDPAAGGEGLLSIELDLPVLSVVSGDPATSSGVSLEPLCATTGPDRTELTITLGTGPGGSPATSLVDANLDLLDLQVTVELDGGATALGVDVPELCEILDGGQRVTCTLDALLPDDLGVVLDTAGEDAGATIAVTQGGETLDVKTVDVLPSADDVTGAAGGGGTGGGTDLSGALDGLTDPLGGAATVTTTAP